MLKSRQQCRRRTWRSHNSTISHVIPGVGVTELGKADTTRDISGLIIIARPRGSRSARQNARHQLDRFRSRVASYGVRAIVELTSEDKFLRITSRERLSVIEALCLDHADIVSVDVGGKGWLDYRATDSTSHNTGRPPKRRDYSRRKGSASRAYDASDRVRGEELDRRPQGMLGERQSTYAIDDARPKTY